MKLVERLRLGGPNAAEVASEAADEIERLQRNWPNPADHRYWEGRYRDEAAEVDRLRRKIEAIEKLTQTATVDSPQGAALRLQSIRAELGITANDPRLTPET